MAENYRIFDRKAIVDDPVRIHADGRENYDEFVSNATPRGRSIGRFKISYVRKRRKSPCVQLPRRKAHHIEINPQGFCFSRNPSIPEMITERLLDTLAPSQSSMTFERYDSFPIWLDSNTDSSTDSDDAISSTESVHTISSSSDSDDTSSSVTSSSGLFILPKDPSRSSSRNTFNEIHSERTSTISLGLNNITWP